MWQRRKLQRNGLCLRSGLYSGSTDPSLRRDRRIIDSDQSRTSDPDPIVPVCSMEDNVQRSNMLSRPSSFRPVLSVGSSSSRLGYRPVNSQAATYRIAPAYRLRALRRVVKHREPADEQPLRRAPPALLPMQLIELLPLRSNARLRLGR
jgi:hypothetical protein